MRVACRASLLPLLLAAACAAPSGHGRQPDNAATRLGLPAASVLPAWAESLADPLPATTFRLLALDDRHRAAHPLGAAVSAVVRERVARHLGCTSLVRTAEQDLAAVPASERNADAEAIAGAFAAAMAAAPQVIPDDVYARAEQRFGAAGVVALVHSVAYANFQSRLLHGLGLADGAAAKHLPLAAEAAPPDVPAPERPAAANTTTTSLAPANWTAGVAADMRTRMERQQRATPRLPLPADEQLGHATERERGQAARIVWSRFGYGYQPELTRGWITALHAFYREAKVDPIVENSVFWVVTRSNDCFY
jgi:hypothetical protein